MRVVVPLIGRLILALALALIPALVVSLTSGEGTWPGYAVAFGATAFLGGGAVLASGSGARTPTRLEAMSAIAAIWVTLPLAAALPFITVASFSLVDATAQAASGLTASGAVFGAPIGDWPRSLVLHVGLLQWLGGALFLSILFAIIVPFELLPATGGAKGAAQVVEEPLEQALFHAFRAVLPIYGGLTAACFLGLALAGLSPQDAFAIALGAASTGGILPHGGAFARYANPTAEWIMALTMAFAAGSVFWLRFVATRRLRDPTVRIEAMLLLIAIAIIWSAVDVADRRIGGADGSFFDGLRRAFFAAAALISTTGTPIVAEVYAIIPMGLLLGAALIGGASGSPTGGMKIIRAAALVGHGLAELWRALYPRGVRRARFGDGALIPSDVRTIFALAVAQVAAVALVMLMVGPAARDFEEAFRVGVGAVSNVMQIAEGADAPLAAFAAWPAHAKWALFVGMTLGRIEALIAAALLYSLIWRR